MKRAAIKAAMEEELDLCGSSAAAGAAKDRHRAFWAKRRAAFAKKYLTRGGIALVIVHVCLHEIPMLVAGGAALLTYLGLR